MKPWVPWRLSGVLGGMSNSELAPGRRFELRTLRLTDRRRPFKNRDSNSPSVAECRQIARFVTGVAVQTATSLHLEPEHLPGVMT
jgi:hypothetical protein